MHLRVNIPEMRLIVTPHGRSSALDPPDISRDVVNVISNAVDGTKFRHEIVHPELLACVRPGKLES